MNYALASLAVELLLFASAWLAVGLSIRAHRKACFSWAWGWLLIALAALLMFVRPAWAALNMDVPINFLLLTAFLLLQQGLAHMAQRTPHPAYMLTTYGGMLAIEMARWLLPGQNGLLAWIFACTLAVPVGGIIAMLWSRAPVWFRRRPGAQILLAAPPILTVLTLMVRATMMSVDSTQPSHFNFENSTVFIVGITTAFQVFLGLFNFSLFALVLGSMIRRLDSLATQDQLTGLDNRRTMLEQLVSAHAQFLQSGQTYALVLLDLDQFKRVNDRYGHLVGDKSLRTIARRLRAGLREGEVLARFGGDDFLLLLPQTDLASACKHAEHLRTVVANSPISTARGAVSLTLSIGVTVARQTDPDGTSALVRADTALHQARNQGRNCLRVA